MSIHCLPHQRCPQVWAWGRAAYGHSRKRPGRPCFNPMTLLDSQTCACKVTAAPRPRCRHRRLAGGGRALFAQRSSYSELFKNQIKMDSRCYSWCGTLSNWHLPSVGRLRHRPRGHAAADMLQSFLPSVWTHQPLQSPTCPSPASIQRVGFNSSSATEWAAVSRCPGRSQVLERLLPAILIASTMRGRRQTRHRTRLTTVSFAKSRAGSGSSRRWYSRCALGHRAAYGRSHVPHKLTWSRAATSASALPAAGARPSLATPANLCHFSLLHHPTRMPLISVQSKRLVVFHDRSPAATAHLQVVPRQHIDNLDALRPCSQDHELGK